MRKEVFQKEKPKKGVCERIKVGKRWSNTQHFDPCKLIVLTQLFQSSNLFVCHVKGNKKYRTKFKSYLAHSKYVGRI